MNLVPFKNKLLSLTNRRICVTYLYMWIKSIVNACLSFQFTESCMFSMKHLLGLNIIKVLNKSKPKPRMQYLFSTFRHARLPKS